MKKILLLSALLIFSFGFGQTPITDANFSQAISTCLSTNPIDGMCSDSEYGVMPNWDVSQVTDMSYAFFYGAGFNADISAWDVSNVTDMRQMFYQANVFNQPIGNWNVSNVNDMNSMFVRAYAFNQDISNWDVSSVTDMTFMFVRTPFNQPIGNWDVSSVTDMSGMFLYASVFNADISNWDVSSVTDMSGMFQWASSFSQPVGGWDVSSVTNMGGMFNRALSFNEPIGNWDVSSVTDMYQMFYDASSFNQDLTAWCVTNIPSEPTDFSSSSPLTESNKPVWGTCPSLGIDDLNKLDISTYPNPVKNMLTIDGLVVQEVVIYSVLGKAVLNISNQNTIDVSSLSKGVYFIKISDGINASTKKFIKE